MSDSSKAEGQVIREQFREACRAEVPNLADVRKCREIFYEFLVDRTLEIMEADRNKETSSYQAQRRFRCHQQ